MDKKLNEKLTKLRINTRRSGFLIESKTFVFTWFDSHWSSARCKLIHIWMRVCRLVCVGRNVLTDSFRPFSFRFDDAENKRSTLNGVTTKANQVMRNALVILCCNKMQRINRNKIIFFFYSMRWRSDYVEIHCNSLAIVILARPFIHSSDQTVVL